VWDAATGAELFTLRGLKDWTYGVDWAPDGRRIGVGSSDGTVKVFDAGSGWELFALRGHTAAVHGVAFSPDGSLLASGARDGMVRLWDSTHGQEVLPLNVGTSQRIDSLRLSADGSMIGYAFWVPQVGNIVKVCAADTGRDILKETKLGAVNNEPLVMVRANTMSLAFSPEGRYFAAGAGRKVRFWDLATSREGPTMESSGDIKRIIFSPDGKTVALAAPGDVTQDRVTLRGLADGRETFSVVASVFGLTFSPDGSLAAFLDPKSRAVSVVEVSSGQTVRLMRGRDGKPMIVEVAGDFSEYAGSLAYSADGRRLLLCDPGQGDVIVWDAGSGQLLHSHKGLAGKSVQLSAFSPDGSRLAAVSPGKKELTLWDTGTGQQVFAFEGTSLRGAAQGGTLLWSADGSTLAARDTANHVRLWSATPRTEAVQAAGRAAWGDYSLGWHRRAAWDSEREKHWFAAAFHLSQVIGAGPAGGSLFLRRGLANAQAERWAQAADDFGRAIELDRIDTFQTRFRQALLLRRKGDLPGYRRAVAFLLERWGDTADAKVARRLLQVYLLDGEKPLDRRQAERFVRVILSKDEIAVTVPVRFGTRLEKAKDYAELRQLLKTIGTKKEKEAGTWIFFPFLCERLGDDYEATFWLDRAPETIAASRKHLIDVIEGRVNQFERGEVSWEDVLVLDLLQREIDALRKKAGH
jgi:WD40 repeat protein